MSFERNGRAQEAVEAILSAIAEIEERRPEIPWQQVRDMRHRIAHEYLSVDLQMVWDVATTDLAPLRAALLAERDFLTSC